METDDKLGHESIAALTDWSKWLITINFLSATGCIVALKSADDVKPRIGAFFFAAIVCFCLSVICSTLFVFLLARARLKQGANPRRYTWLTMMQWIFFTTGLAFVLTWIGFLSKVF